MLQKQSKPIFDEVNKVWRILRHDGVIVGCYATKKLAQTTIDKSSWLL